jgi:hypothetical protein
MNKIKLLFTLCFFSNLIFSSCKTDKSYSIRCNLKTLSKSDREKLYEICLRPKALLDSNISDNVDSLDINTNNGDEAINRDVFNLYVFVTMDFNLFKSVVDFLSALDCSFEAFESDDIDSESTSGEGFKKINITDQELKDKQEINTDAIDSSKKDN